MDYQEEQSNNQQVAETFIQAVRPDIFALMKQIDLHSFNYRILNSVIRNIYNICSGTKYGKVVIEIENGQVTFIRGEEAERIYEHAMKSS